MKDSSRIASLDGLRALSIALVLVGHSLPFSAHAKIGDLANLGVRVFFVISGLLITSLLLTEHAKRGAISLARFFARRAIRILPPLAAFLVAVLLAEQIGWLPESRVADWVRALTYTINYVPATERPQHLGHLWSLAVEEQFYLLWPAVIVLAGARRALKGAALVVLLVPIVRFLTWQYLPDHRDGIKWEFQTVCDALATGCCCAGLRDRLWENERYQRVMQSRWPLLLIPLALVVNWTIVGRERVGYLFGITALNISIALFIEYCIRNADSIGGRLLNWRPVVWLGLISYSMYLWQQLFFVAHPSTVLQTLPLNALVVVAIAALSYFGLERPLVTWRQRLART